MLWLEWEGGQLPIGWNDNRPFLTIESLFGTSWNVYKGENAGMAVVSPFQCSPRRDVSAHVAGVALSEQPVL